MFSILKIIPQDGTFNQFEPVKTWVLPRVRLGSPCFSFDLKAATDRLPIDFQKDVLSLVFGQWFSFFWGLILDRDWLYKDQPIRYAVGQPIGAYSSWGMLAFCHHILVQLAALRAGWTSWFPWYAIVGDDIVIADRAVADQYLSIMRHLGVTISLNKSIVSESGLLEFAKRWSSGVHGDLSGISPSLLMGCIRSPHLIAVLAVHLFEREWLTYPHQLEGIMEAASRVCKVPQRLLALIFATVVGPSGLLRNGFHLTEFSERWFTAITKHPMGSAVHFIIMAFQAMVNEDIADLAERGSREMDLFINTW